MGSKQKYDDIVRDPELLAKRAKRVGTMLGRQYIIDKITGITKYNEALYDVRCLDCGYVYHDARIPDINRKIYNKEGCKHGPEHTTYIRWKNPRIGNIYKNMLARCYDPKSNRYYIYGAKGITVCEEWRNNPNAFEDWALANGYQDNFTINRKDSSKGYSPENCEWISRSENSKFDKSNVTTFRVDGNRYNASDIDKMFNLRVGYTYTYFKKYGYDQTCEWIHDLITEQIPVPDRYSHTRIIDLDGCYCMSVTDWANFLGVVYSTVYMHCTNYDIDHMYRYLRRMILERIGYINLYGTPITIEFIAQVTGLDYNMLKQGYIDLGPAFLLNIMNHNGFIVFDPERMKFK